MNRKTFGIPEDNAALETLKAGEEVLISGRIFTARDQAHKLICERIRAGRSLPFPVKGAAFYYCGPAGTPRGRPIGSCGPTTSRRMDGFTPFLLGKGLKVMIGKGSRSAEVAAAIRKSKAVYLLAPAGCGALAARFVKSKTLRAFAALGPDAVYELEVRDMPLVVGIDSRGKSVFTR